MVPDHKADCTGRLVVREATEHDAQGVRQIKALCASELRRVYRPTAKARAAGMPAARARRQFVCESGGRVAGAVQCELRERALHLIGLFVHPDLRRRGVARAMVDHLADIASAAGKTALSLHTVRQTGNVPICQRLGFRVVRESLCDPELDESVTGESLTDVYMERPLKNP
jgi:GNAT superfamily N-acetyltransferase